MPRPTVSAPTMIPTLLAAGELKSITAGWFPSECLRQHSGSAPPVTHDPRGGARKEESRTHTSLMIIQAFAEWRSDEGRSVNAERESHVFITAYTRAVGTG